MQESCDWLPAQQSDQRPPKIHKNYSTNTTPNLHWQHRNMYGKDNEEKAIQLMEGQVHTVEGKGLVVCPDHPWFGASPDGIFDSAQLLEIKCPLKCPIAEFLRRPNGDIRCSSDGNYVILPHGPSGDYLQVGGNMWIKALDTSKISGWLWL